MELPKTKRPIQNYNPQFMILFGRPKSGKSTIAAAIDDNLILDLEDGYRALEAIVLYTPTAKSLFEARKALQEEMDKTGKKPYKCITIDNATRLEEVCMPYAIQLYQKTPLGQHYDGNDLRTLPQGAGYTFIRKAVREMIDWFRPYCDTLILIAHTRDKQINRDGEEMTEMSLELSGKLGDILCGEADAVGYVYRKENLTMINFDSGDNVIKGARPLHLKNKKIAIASSDENGNITVDVSKLLTNA